MKRSEILDTSSLFVDLARDLDSSLTSETGKTLNIVEFIQQEVDLGIDLTRNQLLPLKICYGCQLDEEDLAVLDYWKAAGKTTIKNNLTAPPQVMIMESGRRCLTGDTKVLLPYKDPYSRTPFDYVTFNELDKRYFGHSQQKEADITLEISRYSHTTLATKIYRYLTDELITLVTKESHIIGTPDHRMYVEGKGWLAMKEICRTDKLRTLYCEPSEIFKVKRKKLTTPTYVYDLHVPDGNWYIANGLWSHNSGKSTLAALIAAYEFYFMSKLDNPQKHFKVATSTPIGILCLATTAEQARRNIFRQILQILRNSEYFMQLEKKKEIFLGKEEIAYEAKGLYIQSGNSKSASQVGSTLKCFILDEASRFQDSEGSSNALELWSNIGISAAPFGAQAKLIAISSAWYEGDAIQKLYQSTEHDPFAVGFKLVSWDLNTTINKDNPIVAHEYAENPDKAALEYEGIRPAAVDAFLDIYQIKKAIIGNSVLKVQPYVSTEKEVSLVKLSIDSIERRNISDTILHIDPAIRADTYALAFGHSEFNEDNEQIVIIDGILAWQPGVKQEVSISNVGAIIRAINVHRPLAKVTADHYNSAETIQRLRQDGILAEIVYFSNRQQLMMYTRLKTLLAENKLILPKDSPWSDLMYKELSQVQLINNRKIDHPSDNNGSKDIADAIASVAYELSERVLIDNVTPSSNIGFYQYQTNTPYAELSYREKALNKLKMRREWAKNELNNIKARPPQDRPLI